MIRLNILLFLFSSMMFACGQNHSSNQRDNTNKAHNSNTTIGQLSFDTSKVVILPIDTANRWLFKDVTPLNLTNQNLDLIDKLLSDCIKAHNANQDTTKKFSEYIDLKKYKKQYVPFINSKGERKAYVNCFCISDFANEFDYWKKTLVEVDDGGSCFFHVTINLSTLQYEQLFTNGYA